MYARPTEWTHAGTRPPSPKKAGQVRVAGVSYDVVFEDAGTDEEALIDAAYEAKHSNATDAFAIPIMQGEVPKTAAVRVSLR